MKRTIFILFILFFLTGCYFTADGPYIGGKPLKLPCWMDSNCVSPKQIEKERQLCHEQGKLYGTAGCIVKCWSKEEVEKYKSDCLMKGWKYEDWNDWLKNPDGDFSVHCQRPYEE